MDDTEFFRVGNRLYKISSIDWINADYIEFLTLTVYMKKSFPVEVEGLDAIDLVMAVKPSLFEGKRLRFPKHAWIVHNLIAHPLMQILALVGFRKQALWLHEVTIPRPIGKR